MLNPLWTAALSATLAGGSGPLVNAPAEGYYQPAAPTQQFAGPVAGNEGFAAGSAEQQFPYDSPEPWLHGYIQEIPAYGGYCSFQPYNYQHVLAQSQAAGGWGMPPVMPYSQQFWHRYQEQAAMKHYLTNVGSTEYAAELARLRAQHDFQIQQRAAGQQRELGPPSSFGQPESQPIPLTGNAVPQLQPITPAAMQQQLQQPQQVQLLPTQTQQPQSQAQIDAMRKQIEMQQAKVRALEMTLQAQRQQQQQAQQQNLQQQQTAQQQTDKRTQKPRSSGIKPIFER